MVYMEQLTRGVYLAQPRDVDTYVEVMERLCVAAEAPDRTLELLDEILAGRG